MNTVISLPAAAVGVIAFAVVMLVFIFGYLLGRSDEKNSRMRKMTGD